MDSATLQDLIDLRARVDLALKLWEGSEGVLFEAAELPPQVATLSSGHTAVMADLVDKLENGKITRDRFVKDASASIQASFEKAYAAGKGVALTDGDREWLRRAVQAETEFVANFADDVANGTGSMDYAKRASMYGKAVNGVAWHGKVEAQPDSVRIHWKLGVAEHCEDCIVLAASGPYRKWNLPTTPRAGSTRCHTNCKCRLVFAKGKMSPEEKADRARYTDKKDQGLDDLLNPPVPKGMRRPNEAERGYIDELRIRINHYRRQIASGELDEEALKAAIRMRADYNAELIEFLDAQRIYDVPVFSVDDVITGVDLSLNAQAEIMRAGLDGATLDVLSEEELANILRRYEDTFDEVLPSGLDDARKLAYESPEMRTSAGADDD